MLHLNRLPGIVYNNRYRALICLLLIIIATYYLVQWGIMCTNIESWQHVGKLCQLYRKGEATGNLCKPLCIDKQIRSLKCHAFHAGKEAVFSADWEGTRLVFKTSQRIKDEYTEPVTWLKTRGLEHYPNEDEFKMMIRDVIALKLNLSISNDQLKRLSRLGFSKHNDISERHNEMKNIWALLQDNEYLCSVLYADRDLFPQLIGTCGPFFAVEYVEPIKSAPTILSLSDSRDDWAGRVKMAVMIMDLLDELDTNLPEPFHLCDVKVSHFGLTKGEQRVKFLDLDSVLPRSVVGHITGGGQQCTKHEDCDYFDCRSKCNLKKLRCDAPVVNNNLQIVCEKIFLGWTLSNTLVLPGLLMSEHTPPSLAALLRICANPEHKKEGLARASASRDVQRRLYATLTEMRNILDNDLFV
ncbi:divergent protein kinase domain 1C isoform X1 [Schistocerca nitens]|uniref:divergent protein kinase domain 1C isoform X1 n=1 Tax=Schistocerca nitens TaxID=7011 RepID=UPI0021193444|nr:divergent protein kinase domain 1C isoform X1 [Schistocerca nitens]